MSKLILKNGINHEELLKYGFIKQWYGDLYYICICGRLNYIEYDVNKGYFVNWITTPDFQGKYPPRTDGHELFKKMTKDSAWYKENFTDLKGKIESIIEILED